MLIKFQVWRVGLKVLSMDIIVKIDMFCRDSLQKCLIYISQNHFIVGYWRVSDGFSTQSTRYFFLLDFPHKVPGIFFCCQPEQALEQTVDLSAISDIMTLV